MNGRAIVACFALFAITPAYAQDAFIYVEVNKTRAPENLILGDPLEQLNEDLLTTRSDVLYLYTDFASRAGNELRTFLKNVTGFAGDVIGRLDLTAFNESDECWIKFENRMKKIEHDARRAAIYSGDSHHKFLLGHMIVFRMHLNKSEDYLKRSDKMIKGCGYACESTPRVKRWRRLAMDEIKRVKDDMEHTRRSYRDIVSHARRKLNHLRKQASNKSKIAIEDYKYCISSL